MRLTDSPSKSLTPLDSLTAALAGLGLAEVHALDGGEPAAAGQVFLVKPRLQLAQHFTLEVDLLIYDRLLGTVGLVYELRAEGTQIDEEVRKGIDHAAYVRHLVLNDPQLGDRLPLTVELTFVARHDHLAPFGKAMSRVAHENRSFLDALGVSLLVAPFAPADLRRAFPWLLQATRAWYEAQKPTEPGEPRKPLRTIELVNYRLPGRRILDLQPAPVHLVFGQNGSGKSSLVEALELTVTGKAERLKGESDYSSVICNPSAGDSSPARVVLHYSEEDGHTYEVGPAEGIPDALSPGLPATGFRLDQIVMDRLTRKGDAERAEVFLESFFPAEHKSLRDFQTSREKAATTLRSLPPALSGQLFDGEDTAEDVLSQLAFLEEPQSRLPPAMAAACLPLSPDHLKALGDLSPELARLHSAWSQEPTVAEAPALLGQIDETLTSLRGSLSGPLEALRNAREGLQRIAGWNATGRTGSTAEEFLFDLNRWLRQCALADLAERHCQLLESLSGAHRAGWEPDPDTLGPFAEPPAEASYLADLRKQAAEWADERDSLFRKVMAATPSAGKSETSQTAIPRLSRVQKDSLNAAGRWLLPPSTDPGRSQLLGDAIEQALNTDSPVQAGDLAVGVGEWAKPLLDRLSRLEEAAKALQNSNAPAGGLNFKTLNEVRVNYGVMKEAGARIAQSFVRQLQGEPNTQGGRLVDALNELMALFTPSRWDYKDIDLRYRRESAREELGFRIGESVQAALRLNTAQLNLFTVALFLLCAVRVDNKLGLMVLDDPLQNMDELTVTTLARGVAKVSRLWGEGWRLLLLFHGQEDCDRFCQEIPLALHRLPWLSQGEEASKELDPVLYPGGLQSLTQVARTPEA